MFYPSIAVKVTYDQQDLTFLIVKGQKKSSKVDFYKISTEWQLESTVEENSDHGLIRDCQKAHGKTVVKRNKVIWSDDIKIELSGHQARQ